MEFYGITDATVHVIVYEVYQKEYNYDDLASLTIRFFV
ncbi:hypothetical protein BMS3Bbin11_00565 [bacterium BMS3Bbin11]|nr:hypothetical protein BMS3Bbin11_00565 [bacterium BMS3Bbin11]